MTCTGLFGPLPVEQSNGNAVTVTVTEQAFPGVHIESINYGGNGTLTYSSTTTGESDFTVGQGINEVTYDNEPNLRATPVSWVSADQQPTAADSRSAP